MKLNDVRGSSMLVVGEVEEAHRDYTNWDVGGLEIARRRQLRIESLARTADLLSEGTAGIDTIG